MHKSFFAPPEKFGFSQNNVTNGRSVLFYASPNIKLGKKCAHRFIKGPVSVCGTDLIKWLRFITRASPVIHSSFQHPNLIFTINPNQLLPKCAQCRPGGIWQKNIGMASTK